MQSPLPSPLRVSMNKVTLYLFIGDEQVHLLAMSPQPVPESHIGLARNFSRTPETPSTWSGTLSLLFLIILLEFLSQLFMCILEFIPERSWFLI